MIAPAAIIPQPIGLVNKKRPIEFIVLNNVAPLDIPLPLPNVPPVIIGTLFVFMAFTIEGPILLPNALNIRKCLYILLMDLNDRTILEITVDNHDPINNPLIINTVLHILLALLAAMPNDI